MPHLHAEVTAVHHTEGWLGHKILTVTCSDERVIHPTTIADIGVGTSLMVNPITSHIFDVAGTNLMYIAKPAFLARLKNGRDNEGKLLAGPR